MWEMYIITRLDAVVTAFTVLLAFSAIGTVAGFAIYYGNKVALGSPSRYSSVEFVKAWVEAGKGWVKIFTPIMVASMIAVTLIPSTREALMIFGVGSTYEYIKSSDVAKQLPDKTLDFLNAWIEKETEDMQNGNYNRQ